MKIAQTINRRIFYEISKFVGLEYGNWSFSQEGEDLILSDLFKGVENGFYVDVGAFHPRRFSNTYRFYKRGWRGINIDPTPGSMKKFLGERSRDINLEIGISREEIFLKLFEFSDPALNTFSEEVAMERKSQYRLISTSEIVSRPLRAVLRDRLPADTRIDFLDVDVEGYDMEVLQSNDWGVFRPKVVLVEVLESPRLDVALKDQKSVFLVSQGYCPIGKTYRTIFFVEEDCLGTLEERGGLVADN